MSAPERRPTLLVDAAVLAAELVALAGTDDHSSIVLLRDLPQQGPRSHETAQVGLLMLFCYLSEVAVNGNDEKVLDLALEVSALGEEHADAKWAILGMLAAEYEMSGGDPDMFAAAVGAPGEGDGRRFYNQMLSLLEELIDATAESEGSSRDSLLAEWIRSVREDVQANDLRDRQCGEAAEGTMPFAAELTAVNRHSPQLALEVVLSLEDHGTRGRSACNETMEALVSALAAENARFENPSSRDRPDVAEYTRTLGEDERNALLLLERKRRTERRTEAEEMLWTAQVLRTLNVLLDDYSRHTGVVAADAALALSAKEAAAEPRRDVLAQETVELVQVFRREALDAIGLLGTSAALDSDGGGGVRTGLARLLSHLVLRQVELDEDPSDTVAALDLAVAEVSSWPETRAWPRATMLHELRRRYEATGDLEHPVSAQVRRLTRPEGSHVMWCFETLVTIDELTGELADAEGCDRDDILARWDGS